MAYGGSEKGEQEARPVDSEKKSDAAGIPLSAGLRAGARAAVRSPLIQRRFPIRIYLPRIQKDDRNFGTIPY